MNILKYSLSFAILLKCVVASESDIPQDVRDVVDREDFERIKRNWIVWWPRKDLFDYVITKRFSVIIRFIENIMDARAYIFAALFDKRPEMVDAVLEGVGYPNKDQDFAHLSSHRHELAEMPKFFKILDKIEEPGYQEDAVRMSVINLLQAKKQNAIVPLGDALEGRLLNGKHLKNVAIKWAFYEGVKSDAEGIVKEFHDHPVITADEYATGLNESWRSGKPTPLFRFLLSQADKGDLLGLMKAQYYKYDANFRQIVDDAIEKAAPEGTRHERGRARFAIIILIHIRNSEEWGQEPGNIITSYLVGKQQ